MANGGTDAEDAATADTAEEWLNPIRPAAVPTCWKAGNRGVETVLVRNENYWGEAPAIERIIIRNIPEAATQKIQLEAGDIDLAFDLTSDQIPSLQDNADVSIYEGLSDTLIFLKGNQDPEVGGPMSDPLVQAAVRYAMDYEGIRLLSGGQAATPASMLPIGFLGAYEANTGLARDIEKSKELLAEAGYPDGLDIDLAYPDFTFAGVNFGTFAQKIQADLNEAGFNVTLAPAEVQVALEDYRQGTEPFGLWLWLPDYRDSLDYVEFLPEGVVGDARPLDGRQRRRRHPGPARCAQDRDRRRGACGHVRRDAGLPDGEGPLRAAPPARHPDRPEQCTRRLRLQPAVAGGPGFVEQVTMTRWQGDRVRG